MHANLLILALVSGCLSLLADSANLQAVREIWVPEGWNPPEVAEGGRRRSYKPSVPSGFQKRNIGATLHLGSVSVHRNRGSKGPTKTYTLRIGDKDVAVAPGGSVLLSGKRYRVVGEKDDLLILQDRKTKGLIRFRKESADSQETPPETSSPSSGK